MSQCVDDQISYVESIDNINLLPFLLSYGTLIRGCQECEEGFMPLKGVNFFVENHFSLETIHKICIEFDPTPEFIDPEIDNCAAGELNVKHNLRGDLEDEPPETLRYDCINCDSGVLALDGSCAPEDTHENCDLAQSKTANYCNTCLLGFISVAGICKAGGILDVIPNCVEFADSDFKTGAECTKCDNGYYLKSIEVLSDVVTTCIEYEGDIVNCFQFDSTDLERLYCTECNTNNGFILIILDGDTQGEEEGFNRTCVQIGENYDSNCTEYDDKQSNGMLHCNTCNDSSFKKAKDSLFSFCLTVSEVEFCAEYDIDKTLGTEIDNFTYDYNYIPSSSTLKCNECDEDYYLIQESNTCEDRVNTNVVYEDRCEEFEVYEDFCKTCTGEYVLNVDKDECVATVEGESSQGSIMRCISMDECHPEVFREGLHKDLAAILSCHACKDPNAIPFVAVDGGEDFLKIQGIKAWGLNFDIYSLDSGTQSTVCKEITRYEFGISGDDWAFPENCGVGVINTDAPKSSVDSTSAADVEADNIGVFCGACAPGYRRTDAYYNVTQIVPLMTPSCELIENCLDSWAFNNCSKCEKNYSFEFDIDTKTVLFDYCVEVVDNPNCLAYDPGEEICKYCYKGYYLNKDNVCEYIQPTNCLYGEFSNQIPFNAENLALGLSLYKRGQGCAQCKKDYFPVRVEENYWVCTESEYISTEISESTNYIYNCENYSVKDNLLVCEKCKSGFIPIDDTGVCTSSSGSLKDCLVASNDSFCLRCSQGFVLVNRLCEKENIPNCAEYLYNENLSFQTCTDCIAGYYLEANSCHEGEVENCYLFETVTVCNQCQPGYQLVRRNDNTSYCYPIDKRTNCLEFDLNEFQKNTLSCVKCSSHLFFLDSNDDHFYPTHCMKFFEYANCLEYDIQPAIGDSGFLCLKCTVNFYLEDQVCKLRKNKLDLCREYSETEDKCTECAFGYYPNDSGSDCESYPTGVPFCREYEDNQTCKSCVEGKYLKAGLCVDILEENLVENCLYHTAPNVCEECSTGFIYLNNKCEKTVATGCKTFESGTTCGSCLENLSLIDDEDIRYCGKTEVENCIVSVDLTPEECKKCVSGFFLDGGKCKQVDEPIEGCVDYESETICIRCDSNYLMNLENTHCIRNRFTFKNIDENCQESVALETPTCNVCDDASVFQDNECVPCQGELVDRCFICHPEKLEQCLVCNSGYFQNIQGACLHMDEVPTEDDEQNDDNQNDDENNNNDPDDIIIDDVNTISIILLSKAFILFFIWTN